MGKEIIQELFDAIESDFDIHLNLKNNERVILSGKYGAGKTTFIEYYFEKRPENYNVVRLRPINYSISSNEDVFRYIKHDILYHLLEDKQLHFEDFDFSKIHTGSQFIHDNILDVISTFLPLIPKFGGNIQKVYENFKKLDERYKEFHKSSNANQDKEEVDAFLIQMVKKEGSIYENNLITQIIQECLGQIRIDGDKENVLIVDDLDRIDPNHIFRLFNVFAAHLDEKDNMQNKFGFDKIIFVCDIENIRNIFRNRYGTDVDFGGYIDKFYSKKIFYYNNIQALREYCKRLISEVNFQFEDEQLQQWWGTSSVGRNAFHLDLDEIVLKMVYNNQINLRALLKDKKKFTFQIRKMVFPSITTSQNPQNFYINSVLVIEFLLSLFGEKNKLIEALESCIDRRETPLQMQNKMLSNILVLTEYRKHLFRSGRKFSMMYNTKSLDCHLKEASRGNFMHIRFEESNTAMISGVLTKDKNEDDELNFFNQYIEGVKILDEISYLK